MSSVILRGMKKLVSFLLVFALILVQAPIISYAETTAVVYHETFEDGTGAAVQSGGASFAHVTGKVFEDNDDGGALYISNRSNDYVAADFPFDVLGLEDGKTYSITVKGYIDEDVEVPGGAQAVLSTNKTYNWLNTANYVSGEAFTLCAEYTVNASSEDTALRIQSNSDGATVPFYIGDITITVKPEAPVDIEVYHETFEEGKGIAAQSGGASLAHVTDMAFEGNDDGGALYVNNRVNNWDAADFNYSDIGVENGKTYTVTVKGYVESGVTTDAAIWIQTVEGYGNVASTEITTGEAFTLIGTFTVDTDNDRAIRVNSNDVGATVPFYIGDIRITQKSDDDEEPPRPPAEDFAPIDFEDETNNGFTGRAGTEELTVTVEANHTDDGAYSLKVEGRTSSWHGPQIRVEKNIDKGSEYKATVWVKLKDPESAEITLSTQIGDGEGASYPNLQKKTIRASDDWVRFEGTYRYNNVGNEFVTLYVESSNTTASFYIDDISFEPTGSGPVDIERALTPIKAVYENHFLIGNVMSSDTLEGLKFELLNLHHNSATAENAMKVGELQNQKGVFTFDAADELVNAALAEGLKVHGHVLVWHQQSPDWMNTGTDGEGNTVYLTREEALDNMKTHIRTVMEHFEDKVISWDVVNEAMADNPPSPEDWEASLRQSPWYHAIGPDFVEQAFLEARAVLDDHPEWEEIKLYYNDYNLDNQNKSIAVANMVEEINDRYAAENDGKLLIDGIGMQGHYSLSTNPANVELSLERFISLGVEVSITELDIQAGSNNQLPDNLATAQGYLYAQLFNIFIDHHENIARVTFWGLDDGSSWRASSSPLLFGRDLKAKPAYYGVIDPDTFMEENLPTEPPDAKQSTADYTKTAPVIDGAIDAVWNNTAKLPINRYQMAWQGATGTARVLWDEENLFVLFEVEDTELDKTSPNAHEQDSVEAFVDENNGKTSFYQDDDGQYRINYDNETSFNPAGIAEGFESATSVSGTNYTVEMKIPFKTISPADGTRIGFDAQINDGKGGTRQSVAAWNDTTGNAFQDTSVFGIITLKLPGSGKGSSPSFPTQHPKITKESGQSVKIEPVPFLNYLTGEAIASISKIYFKDALDLAEPDSSGNKVISIVVRKIDGADKYTQRLPVEALTDEESDHQLIIDTPAGTIRAPGNMFSSDQVKNGQNILLTIGKASTADLSDDLRYRIGDRPVIELNAKLDGKELSWNNPDAPVTVSIDYTPTAEELADPEHITLWYIDGNGNAIPVPNARYNPETGTLTFSTTHFSKFAVAFVMKTFIDSGLYSWAQKSIDILASKRIMSGVTKTQFMPGDNMIRGEFIGSLVRTLGLSASFDTSFDDVYPEYEYYYEIGIAKKLGITNGIGGNRCGVDLYLTRQDMMVLVSRALKAAGKSTIRGSILELNQFSDASLVAPYAIESVSSILKEGLIVGSDGILAPNGYATRASAAVFLHKIINK